MVKEEWKDIPFWDRVAMCKHENLSPDYCESFNCGTPYCSGNEVHCLDCGAFISDCGCHSNYGVSGWSGKRHKNNLVRYSTG